MSGEFSAEWISDKLAQNSKSILVVLFAFILLGAGYSGFRVWKDGQEMKLQEAYYKIEKKLTDRRQEFEKHKNAKATNQPLVGVEASGDFEKDFGAVAGEMKNFVMAHPKSEAAQMGALALSQIYFEYSQWSAAIEVLNQVKQTRLDLLSGMVQMQLANALANNNQCPEAVSYWGQLVKEKNLEFAHPQIRLNLGLCYENMKDWSKARDYYTQAKAVTADSSVGKAAERYLKLLDLSQPAQNVQ